jgi:murein tripeptide amidase MpaA
VDWYILPSVNPDGYAYSIKTERKGSLITYIQCFFS